MAEVEVTLPQFKSEQSFELVEKLKAIGLTIPFDSKRADFRGIRTLNADESLFISSAFHRARISVDENGTEAAAATALVMGKGRGLQPPRRSFVADRPFLYFIVHRASGVILFMGRYSRPS